jgi:histone H3/H4
MADRTLTVKIVGDERDLQRSFQRSSRGAQNLERDLGRATRGVVAGSGAFRSLGRSIAFASGGFLAFASIGEVIRKSVDAAIEGEVAQRQLARQLGNSGLSFAKYRKQIEATNLQLGALAGFQNDELNTALTTILRTTGNVAKAQRDLATAADLARAKHIGLNQAALIIAKTEAGNTTLLRRQGFQIAKNATAEQALATLRRVVAGQAAAGTTEQQRFGAVLHDTEEILGAGLLPTLNKYLARSTDWLSQSQNQERIQRDVTETVRVSTKIVEEFANSAQKAADAVGGFKHLIEGLAAIKLATVFAGWSRSLGLLGASAGEAGAAGEVGLLLTRLGVLSGVGPVLLTVVVAEKTRRDPHSILDRLDFLTKHRKDLELVPNLGPVVNAIGKVTDALNKDEEAARRASAALRDIGAHGALRGALPEARFHIRRFAGADATTPTVPTRRPGITATQRNTFFDDLIGRRRDRVADIQSLRGQAAALVGIARVIEAEISRVHDKTRDLTLSDDLASVMRQRRGILQQIAEQAKQSAKDIAEQNKRAAEDAKRAAEEAAANLLRLRNALQFKALGLGPTGDTLTPRVAALRKELSRLTKGIDGTILDNRRTSSLISRLRKVLGGGLGALSEDVRKKVAEMLSGLDKQLKDHATKTRDTRRHFDTSAVLAGLGLSPDEIRALRSRLSMIGPGGTVPTRRTGAFALAGGTTYVLNNAQFHGVTDVAAFEEQLRKRRGQRAPSRRGPYAGRN